MRSSVATLQNVGEGGLKQSWRNWTKSCMGWERGETCSKTMTRCRSAKLDNVARAYFCVRQHVLRVEVRITKCALPHTELYSVGRAGVAVSAKELIWLENNDFAAWCCESCGWVMVPPPSSVSDNPPTEVTVVFDKHECAKFPRHVEPGIERWTRRSRGDRRSKTSL
jgi:hypothetical protein